MEGHDCTYIVEPYLRQGSTAEILQKRRWGWGGLKAGSLRRQSVILETGGGGPKGGGGERRKGVDHM